MLPLVSIIIPCYNGAAFVGEAIESALAQDYSLIEVIVIDDGSTDDSLEIIKKFSKRVRVETGENRGGCAARNLGLQLAQGQLIQFLDADDLLDSRKLSVQVEHVTTKCAPDQLSICLGRVDGNEPFYQWQLARLLDADRDPVDFVLNGVLATMAPLHRRSDLLQVGGFDPALRCAQEWDLHLRLVCGGVRLRQLPEPLYTVRRQPGSVSSDSSKVILQRLRILKNALAILLERQELTRDRRFAIAKLLAQTATVLELGGNAAAAAEYWDEAKSQEPNIEVLSWPPRWRPLVRMLGALRTERFRQRIRGVLKV